MEMKNMLILGLCACSLLACQEVAPPAPGSTCSDTGTDRMAENGKLCFCTFRAEYFQ